MLTQIRAKTGFFRSRALTAAIVSSVVLVNSVAWGIPLLVGSGQSKSRPAYSDIRTGSLPKAQPGSNFSRTALKPIESRLPLPVQAPPIGTAQVAKQVAAVSGVGEQRSAKRRPITMYPRPEPTPILGKQVRSQPAPKLASARTTTQSGVRRTVREVVLVSPYTPGVRIAPGALNNEWRHRQVGSAADGVSTLDKARAIARRAAQRFEQMRDRITRADRHAADPDRSQRRSALLPVAPRPPRIVEAPGGRRSASKSAHSYVRARLVRRPIGASGTAAPRTRQFALAPADIGSMSGAATPAEASQATRPSRVVRPSPTVRGAARRRTSERSRRRVARARARRRSVVRRRARQRTVRTRRAPRKVNGFRRSFHRQLVAANFFGGGR